MLVRLGKEERRLLSRIRSDLLLGIITSEGVVRLALGSAKERPGHLEWIKRDRIANAVRGFSVMVKDGLVCGLYPLSRLNPTADSKLEARLIRELKAVLPSDPELEVFGY